MNPEVTTEQMLEYLEGEYVSIGHAAGMLDPSDEGDRQHKAHLLLTQDVVDAIRTRLREHDKLKRKLTYTENALKNTTKRAFSLKQEVGRLTEQLNYPDPEDMPGELAAKFCPFKDPLHFHHDGCPSEWAVEEQAKKAEAEVERLSPYEETYKHYEQENSELRAALAIAKPVIEAAMAYYRERSDINEFILRDAVVVYRAAVQNAARGGKK